MQGIEVVKHDPINWDSEYSVKVPAIDSQHKELIGFFNDAIGYCSKDRTAEKKYFDTVIETFITLLENHLRTEEQFLSGSNYDHYDEHVLEHVKLLEKIRLIKHEAETGRWEMNLFVLTITLRNLFMNHLTSYDVHAREYFKEENAIAC